MRAIQHHLPNPHHMEHHRVIVAATPEAAWQAARHFDAADIPWIKALFILRTIPDRLKGKPPDPHMGVGVDEIASRGEGFIIVEEVPGRSVVIGAVGQFWHLSIPFAEVAPADFRDFAEPGWGKLAWAIEVEPYRDGSIISFELRITATDDESWRSLNRYYHVIGPMSHIIRDAAMAHLEAALTPLHLPSDKERPLPGDELLPDAPYQLTHAIDIEAPPAIVWRYLMQLGCDRGGWYSIDTFDHGGVPSVDYQVADWGDRHVGDRLAATPARDGFFDVLAVDTERAFVIGGQTERLGGPFRMTWAFVPEPLGADATHLVARVRMEAEPRWAEWLQGTVLAPPLHGLMQGVQLRVLKHLTERDAMARETTRDSVSEQISIE